MLLAPFSLTELPVRGRLARQPRSVVPMWLMVWAIAGVLALGLFPGLRGGPTSGLSMPFWLVAAPLINILWLTHATWRASLQKIFQRLVAYRQAGNRRSPVAGSRRCRRSSAANRQKRTEATRLR